MLIVKPGVRLHGMKPEVFFAVHAAKPLYDQLLVDTVITAGIEGSHSRGSEHYKGDAADLRTRHIAREQAETLAQVLAKNLGMDYDVVLERTHLHVEWDPKDPY